MLLGLMLRLVSENAVARSCTRFAWLQAFTFGQQLVAARAEQLKPLSFFPTCPNVMPGSSFVCWTTLCTLSRVT